MSTDENNHRGPSWRMMLTLLLLAIVVAALIAYRMIYPFFHQHPR